MPTSRGPYHGSAIAAAMRRASPTSRRRRRASPLRQAPTISYRSGPSTYTGYVGFVSRPRPSTEAERHAPPRPAKSIGLQQHAEGRRHHRGQRQVELEVQQREHDEGRGAEEERREEARPSVPECPARTERRGEADGEKDQQDALGREGGDREDQVEGAGGARDQGRIEGRVPDHRRPDAPLRQVLGAAEGALEVVGVVPLGRTPVDADPRDGDGGEDGEEHGEPDSRIPNGTPCGAAATVRCRTGR